MDGYKKVSFSNSLFKLRFYVSTPYIWVYRVYWYYIWGLKVSLRSTFSIRSIL
jgi:hypothetical protein